ncbi:hypothetical protein EJMLMN_EJMLMN_04190, partial [Dysosmobacter welbionis]
GGVHQIPVADGLVHSGGDGPAVKGRGAAPGEEGTAVDGMGPVQIQHGQIRDLSRLDLSAGQAEQPPGIDAQGVQQRGEGDDARLHQLRIQHREGTLQPHDAVEAAESPRLLLRAVGGVVRGDAVDGAVQQPFDQSIPVRGGADGGIHLEPAVIHQVLVAEDQVVGPGLAGYRQPLRLGLADEGH